ncbi:methyl-accepting chemotaxis protein [Tepidibacter hydrothermalis]|uniref:Methyl-accepting chemotaxis protein n=1 Tax=Tepidibacter hydrothermalis TaxID=3036126 RepID=A0ABY8EAI9_9FIRM|nr:methyl-accepting chemotaxis protein [Tepidibacter hydrothermalis]WFD08819.1 methyl-accepting chemotaxis protein [Tepidibacter hydrothermalis]
MMQFKTIKSTMLSIILPLVIVAMLTLGILGYFYSKAIINDEISKKMNYQLDYVIENIEKRLSNHNQLVLGLAKSVEASIETGKEETYLSMVEKVISTNEETFGSGIWLEPYMLNENEKYFGPYAYKENDKISITMDYSNEEYDYFQCGWYEGVKNIKDTSIWSTPYYDETTDITMITTSAPIYNKNSEFIGAVTADTDLSSIQKMIQDTKVGLQGKAFLIDEDGTYIADQDKQKVMKVKVINDSNKSLANIGEKIIQSEKGNGIYKDKNGDNEIYYARIPQTKWTVALTIPQKELYAPLKTLVKNIIITIITSLFIVISGIVMYANRLTKNISILKETTQSIAQGDFTVKSDIKLKDEIGQLSNNFNTMVQNIKILLLDSKEVSEEVSEAATNLAATSEETSASAEEIARAIEEIAMGATKQAENAAEGAKISSNLDNKFTQLANNSGDMYQRANEVSQINKLGVEVVKELKENTDLNNTSINNIEIAINQLSMKSNNIGEILKTIRSIAEQTNLLALNASIESARAGDAGKGFAVVADEIRKLAEGSQESTDKIKEIVQAIQQESCNTVELMGEVKDISLKQTKSVGDVNGAFEKISYGIESITSNIDDINEFINNMIYDKNEIVHSIENISAVSEETAASSEEISASVDQQSIAVEDVANNAEKLTQLSLKLNDQINKFKI